MSELSVNYSAAAARFYGWTEANPGVAFIALDEGGPGLKTAGVLRGGIIEETELNTFSTVSLTSPDHYVEVVVDRVRREAEILRGMGYTVGGVGMSMATQTDYDSGLLLADPPNFPLGAKPYRNTLEKVEAQTGIPLVGDNDGNAGVLAIAMHSSFATAKRVLYVILGTGIGGAFFNGEKSTIELRTAAEIGHIPVRNPLEVLEELEEIARTERVSLRELLEREMAKYVCGCGGLNCVEFQSSGPGIARIYQALSSRQLDAANIAQLAESGDAEAQEALRRAAKHLVPAVITWGEILDPEIMVFGASVSKSDYLMQQLEAQLRQLEEAGLMQHGKIFSSRIKRSPLDGKESLIGAGILAQLAKMDGKIK